MDGAPATVASAFAGGARAHTALEIARGAERWLSALGALRPELALGGKAVLTRWGDEPYSAGSYACHPPGWSRRDDEEVAAASGRVHLAGEHTAAEFCGTLEGALRSGSRAARDPRGPLVACNCALTHVRSAIYTGAWLTGAGKLDRLCALPGRAGGRATGTGSQLLGAVVVPFRRDITLGRGGEPDRHAVSRHAVQLRGRFRQGGRTRDDLRRAPHGLRDAPVLGHRLQAAELEPHQLDAAGAAQRVEAVVGEEVAREDRAVLQEALGELGLGGVHEAEGLDRGHAALVTGADAGQEEALQRPRARRVREVGAGHEDGVVGRRARRQRARARKRRRGPVLQRRDVPLAVEVDLAPGAELVLDVLRSSARLSTLRSPWPCHQTQLRQTCRPARLRRSGEVLDRHACSA